MKNLIIAAMFLTASAWGSIVGKDSNGAVLGHFDSLKCASDFTCAQVGGDLSMDVTSLTLTGAILGDGGDSLSGFLNAQVASTTASLTIAQCGSTIVSDSADVQVLPEASTALGCRYTFVCGTADDYDINPADASDVIGNYSYISGTNTTVDVAPAAGDAVRCTDIGDGIVLEAVQANLWAVISVMGVVTDVN